MKINSRYLIGSVIATAVVAYLFLEVDVGRSLDMLRNVSPRVMMAAMAAYLTAHAFRALRFGEVLGEDTPPYLCLLSIVSIHNLVNQVMPIRTGESAYPLLVNKVGGIGFARGASSLLLVRAYDLAAFFSIAALALAYSLFDGMALWARAAVVILGAGGAFLVFRYLGGIVESGVRVMVRLALLMGLKGAFSMDASHVLQRFVEELGKSGRSGNTGRLALYSLSVWAATFHMFHVFVNGITGGVGYAQSILGSSGAVLTGLLPVNTFGSVGTLEGGWLAGFSFIGIDKESALASGLLMHAFVIVFGLVLSLAGAAFIRWRCGREA